MRRVYLISYDITEPKRYRVVHKLMLGAGEPLQYSVFRCELTNSERILLLEKLLPAIHHIEDRIMFVDLGPVESDSPDRVKFYGAPPLTTPFRGAVII